MAKVNLYDFYPIEDKIRGVPLEEQGHYMAKWTGEKRKPLKGEWFLSGSIIECYRAPNDLSYDYHIAKVYRVKRETITRIVRIESLD